MGTAINKFTDKFNEFRTLPSGRSFSVTVTDFEATDAAREYLAENKNRVAQLIRNAAGMSLDVSEPTIRFRTNEVSASARGGKGFLKFSASVRADVRWDGRLRVNVRSVDVPVVKLSPEKLNSIVENPLAQVMGKVAEYAEIRSFRILEGAAILEAVKK